MMNMPDRSILKQYYEKRRSIFYGDGRVRKQRVRPDEYESYKWGLGGIDGAVVVDLPDDEYKQIYAKKKASISNDKEKINKLTESLKKEKEKTKAMRKTIKELNAEIKKLKETGVFPCETNAKTRKSRFEILDI
jgi:hypothetical protein